MIFFTKQSLAITILLSFLSFKSQAQILIVDDTLNLKKGVYRSFKEFKYNSPSILDSFTITTEQKKIIKSISESTESNTHTIYHILLPEPYSESDDVWGFCDGKHVYINTRQIYHPDGIFEKIDYLGRYCLFFQWMPNAAGSPAAAKQINPKTNGYLSKRIVNINNGQIYNPDGPNHADLITILSTDKGIYDSYKADKDKNAKTFYYLKVYSEKHKAEIKRP